MIQLPNLFENSFLKYNPLLEILPLLPLIGNAHLWDDITFLIAFDEGELCEGKLNFCATVSSLIKAFQYKALVKCIRVCIIQISILYATLEINLQKSGLISISLPFLLFARFHCYLVTSKYHPSPPHICSKYSNAKWSTITVAFFSLSFCFFTPCWVGMVTICYSS